MSQVITAAIGSVLNAALVVTPTDGRDLKYFKAINKIAQQEFLKAGYNTSDWSNAKWNAEDSHPKFWVAPLITIHGMNHFAKFDMMFEDGDRGYILKGFSLNITSYDDQHKASAVYSKEYMKDVDNYKALISAMISEFRSVLKKLKLEAIFDGNAMDVYSDFLSALGRMAGRRTSKSWIPGIRLSFSYGVYSMDDWTCNRDFENRRSEAIALFAELQSNKKVDIPLEFTPETAIINPKTIAATLLETFPSIKQENDSVVASIVDAKYTGSTLKVTVRLTKK
ncbi:hypothetical protein [Yersinia ruckeri]|uniref:hypothetical protein n=1 Tax=Yersinia ruckeri TaxID=29486 RepID=UPI0022376E93|nr:hypothetical protein [Yersinia ruckeri]MCW6598760.1 hypothetical protein [Yersinia ruckeri]